MAKQSFGIVGLGVMGENLALNIESHGFSVAGFDLDPKKVDNFVARTKGKQVVAARTVAEFVEHLDTPRRVLMMVPAGKAVDAVIADLRPHFRAGDLLIDGGNTFFVDTDRRIKELQGSGILYIGAGVSGGEEGALHGPAIMPGGNPEAWPLVKPILQAIAAKAEDGAPCCEWIGRGGAGHFVKMVHNGIEYGDMQMICEAYFLMERLLGMSAAEMSRVFAEWNRGELSSYLVGITSEILAKNDPDTGKPMVQVILDTAEQKGTGKWTSQVALDLGAAAPTIADAVFARTLSALKKERVAAAGVLAGPAPKFSGDKPAFIEMIRKALFSSKICSLCTGLPALACGRPGIPLGPAIWCHLFPLARGLHHTGPVSGQDHGRVCQEPRSRQFAPRSLFRRRDGFLPARLAQGGLACGGERHCHPRLHERAFLL